MFKYITIVCTILLVLIVVIINGQQTIYVDLESNHYGLGCGVDPTVACVSLQDAMTNVNSISNSNSNSSFTISMAKGVYSGVNNTALQVYNTSITITPTFNGTTVIIQSFNNQSFIISNQTNNNNNNNNNNNSNTNTNIIIQDIQFEYQSLSSSIGSNNGSLVNSIIGINSTFNLLVDGCIITILNNNNNSNNNSSVIGGSGVSYGGLISIQPLNYSNPSTTSYQTVTINNSTITSSIASVGGVLYTSLDNTIININQSIFTNNSAFNGSVIYSAMSTISIENSLFNNNQGLDYNITYKYEYLEGGGAILVYKSQLTITNSSFNNNQHSNGGAILFISNDETNATLSISQSRFLSNQACIAGGALSIVNSATDVKINNCTFQSNQANSSGGSIFASFSAQVVVEQSMFSLDVATHGGSLCLNNTYGEMLGSTITNNTNTLSGGAVFASESTFVSNFTTYSSNNADMGASIFCSASTLMLFNNTYLNNTDSATTKNQVDNIFCSSIACTIFNDQPVSHKCKTIPVITPKTIPPGVIIGIVAGCAIGFFLVFLVIVMVVRHRRANNGTRYEPLLQKQQS